MWKAQQSLFGVFIFGKLEFCGKYVRAARCSQSEMSCVLNFVQPLKFMQIESNKNALKLWKMYAFSLRYKR